METPVSQQCPQGFMRVRTVTCDIVARRSLHEVHKKHDTSGPVAGTLGHAEIYESYETFEQ